MRDFDQADRRQMTTPLLFAAKAANEALADADWLSSDLPDEILQRAGVCIGMGLLDMEYIIDMHRGYTSGTDGRYAYTKVSPFFIPAIISNLAGGNISIKHRLQGPNLCPTAGFAAGCHAVGQAFDVIRAGKADMMLAGATEACISPLTVAGMSLILTVLSDSCTVAKKVIFEVR